MTKSAPQNVEPLMAIAGHEKTKNLMINALAEQAIREWPQNLHLESTLAGLFLTMSSIVLQKDMIFREHTLPELVMGTNPNLPMAVATMLTGLLLLEPSSRVLAQCTKSMSCTAAKITATLLGSGTAYFGASLLFADELGLQSPAMFTIKVSSVMLAFAAFHCLYCILGCTAKSYLETPEAFKQFAASSPDLEKFRLPAAMLFITMSPFIIYMDTHQ